MTNDLNWRKVDAATTKNELLLGYVREKLEADVDALLDDPHGVLHGMNYAEIMAHTQKLYSLCLLVGTRLSELIAKHGLGPEFQRLVAILEKARLESGVSVNDT